MKLREMLAAIREYPKMASEMERLQTVLQESEQQRHTAEEEKRRLCYACKNAEKKVSGYIAAIRACVPPIHGTEDMKELYGSVAPVLDQSGFALYQAASDLTGLSLYEAFPYEDVRGLFTDVDGHQLLRYLTAAHFDAVEWKVVPGTCHEQAILQPVDTHTEQYQAFEHDLYDTALRTMGFGELLESPTSAPVRQHQKERKDMNAR